MINTARISFPYFILLWCSPPIYRIASLTAPAPLTSGQRRGCRSRTPSSILASATSLQDFEQKIRKTKPQWITCATTKELAHAVRTFVQPNHTVAELGAQLRDVSWAIQNQAASSVHVDVKRKFPKQQQNAETRTSSMRRPGDETQFCFTEIESLEDWRTSFSRAHYDVFVLDVNAIVGNDLHFTSLSILREFVNAHNTNIVLVKSESLNQLATRLIHADRWISGKESGPILKTTPIKSPKLIASVGVEQYRATICRTVQPGDTVLELGCHFGTTTNLLHLAAGQTGQAIGVDVGSRIVKSAKEKYPGIQFVVGDAWQTGKLLRLSKKGFDVVYVDVGGLSGADGLLEALFLLTSVLFALEPRCIVIKSLCMRRLSSSLRPYWRYHKEGGGL